MENERMKNGCSIKRNTPKAIAAMTFGLIVIWYSFKNNIIKKINIPTKEVFGFSKENETVINTKYVSVCKDVFNTRRTGNMLFVLAALLYVSKHTGRQPIMPQSFPHGWIDHIFANDLPRFPNNFIYNSEKSQVINEKGGLNFDPVFKNLHIIKSLENATTILICGYFQSCNYVEDVEKELRHFLKFRNVTIQSVDDFINKESNKSTNISFIGLHVRRQDFASDFHIRNGFAVVDENYINVSMNYIISSLDSSRTLVAFVCSDDINWVKNVIQKLKLTDTHPNLKVVYSIGHDAAFDWCLLSKCNASIISTGTYSWWSGWLANTPAVYYSLYPVPNSSLGRNFVAKEYYPAKWKGFP